MAGGLLHSFREGDRLELLADYLLSAIGITTSVKRQDDLGYDFHCQLADNESGFLTFGAPFLIQIKSKSENNKIIYGGEKNWKPENLTWLFRNEIPFLIGFVDKQNSSFEIYDTTGLWQVYNLNHDSCSMVEIAPHPHQKGEMRENCKVTKLQQWNPEYGDGYKYEIDLGNAIVSLDTKDILNPNLLKERKQILRVVC